MSRVHATKTRREFLNEVSGAAAAAAGSGVLGSLTTGCGDTSVGPSSQITAVISGPSELQIPVFGGSVRGDFDGSESTGVITGRDWEVERHNGGFGIDHVHLGQEALVSYDFTRPGVHRVRLEVSGGGEIDSAEHNVVVQAPPMTETDYPCIAFFRHKNDPDAAPDPSAYELCLMSGDDHSVVSTLVTADFLIYRASWEPGSKRIAYARHGAGEPSLYVYDFQSGDEIKVAPGGGFDTQWMPSWSSKDWIAYLDSTRAGSYRELALVRPDGSEQLYLSGTSPHQNYAGFYPSWNPTGEMIALGGARYSSAATSTYFNRVKIYENVFGGTIDTRNLNSEEKIGDFLLTHYPDNVDEFQLYHAEGVRGTAWSPDGEWVAYASAFGESWLDVALLRSRVDGTGDIELLEKAKFVNHVLQCPSWSPDSKQVLYAKVTMNSNIVNLRLIPADGSGEAVKLTDDFHRNEGPSWVV